MEFNFWQNCWQFVLLAVVGYFIGCFNFAHLIAKLKKKDVSKMGSGNPGAMNMTREFGVIIGFLTFFLDAFKGGIPAVIVYHLYGGAVFAGTDFAVGYLGAFVIGAFVVLGHIYPVTLKFKGGKGISSGIGLFWLTLAIENPWSLLIGLAVVATLPFIISWTKIGSLWSLSYLAGFGIWQNVQLLMMYETYNAYFAASMIFVCFVVLISWVAHHKNLRCLFSGEEHETVMIKFKKVIPPHLLFFV